MGLQPMTAGLRLMLTGCWVTPGQHLGCPSVGTENADRVLLSEIARYSHVCGFKGSQ